MTKTDELLIRLTIKRLEELTTEGDSGCTVVDEHKQAVRPYIDSWVTPLLRAVLREVGTEYIRRDPHNA